MADAAKITYLINQVNDPATRNALHKVFGDLKTDLDNNKDVFDTHTHNHYGNGAEENTSQPQSDAEAYTPSTAVSFVQSLKS